MRTAAPIRRFSLLSLVLMVTTIAATSGWIAALRQANEARRETLRLRREIDHYRAELGELQVDDKTRVHAIGRRRDPRDQNRWEWLVYLPTDANWRLVLETDRRQAFDLPTNGELVIAAQLAQDDARTWMISLGVDGSPLASAALPWYEPQVALVFPRIVGTNERSVWEQAERPVLIDARHTRINTDEIGDQVDGQTPNETGFSIWIDTATLQSNVQKNPA